MKCAMFHTPFVKPERTGKQVFDWSLELAKVADKTGYSDFMIGEHYTIAWENIPSPDVVIAAAATVTERVRFAAMAHLLPYHDPATLAIRIGWLSQVLEGRLFVGIAPGAYWSDATLHGWDNVGDLRDPMLECIEIMEKVWAQEPFQFRGKHFKGGFPGPDDMMVKGEPIADNSPYGGRENLEIAVTALSSPSPSIKFAGQNNYSPITFFSGLGRMKSHWDSWSSTMLEHGRTPDRSRYRVCRDIIVAETDEKARELAINGGLGAAGSYLMPVYKEFGLLNDVIEESDRPISVEDLDLDYMADHVWLCGSPETVTKKIQKMYDACGGFGTIVTQTFDYMDNPEPYFESMRLLAEEVVPNIKE